MAEELSTDPRVTAMHAAGFLESWAIRSIRAFEAAGLTVALDDLDGLESRAAAWDEGYKSARDDWEIAVENATVVGTHDHRERALEIVDSPNPYRSQKVQ